MRIIYLSPHLDDAVLSAGGAIYEQTQAGIPVEIWTIMSGFPPEGEVSSLAQEMHAQWGFSSAKETVEMRRAENVRAAAIVGAKAAQFDFLDCIYRRSDRDGSWLYSENIFDPPQPDETSLPAKIAQVVAARLKPDDALVCQLGVGRHVDHVIVRRAAEVLGRLLRYDADIPYLLKRPEELTPITAGMKEKVYAVSEAGLQSWLEAIAAYTSQIGILFEGLEQMREMMRDYWSECRGVRIWEHSNHAREA